MGNCKRSIRDLSYVLLVVELAMGLFIAPVVAQEVEPGPEFNLDPEFVETFDDPAAPDWDLSAGAIVADGILRLEPGGAQTSHEGVWHNYTTVLRVRRTGPGAIGVTYTTAGEDSVRLVLGSELIEAQRVRSGLTVDMIVERLNHEPPEVPVGEWFTLHVTQLDGAIIVGLGGVRLYDLYDPSPDPLPPSGLVLAAVGDVAVEVEKVVVIPWVIEDFEAPLSPAWELSDVTATPFVDKGKLVVPPGGYAVRTGHWEKMTFYARIRRDRLGTAVLTYPGHVLRLHPNFIVLSSEVEGQLHELAGAPLPELPAEPQTATWLDLTVIVRNGEHHVLAYGIELFSVPDEITAGAVTVEALEGELVLNRLMLGPPLPLWPGGGEPGEDPPGVPSADLAVTDLFPDHAPTGRLYLRITNNGPAALQGVPVTVTCGGTEINVTSGALTTIPDAPQGTFSITLAPGQTQAFPTQINLDLNNFDYDLRCTVSAALGSGAFSDPDPGNNTYIEEIFAVTQGASIADLAVTDLFPHHSPMGKLHLRITNHGPDSLQAAPVTVHCGGVMTDLASGVSSRIPTASQGTFDITIAPGQTHEFPTEIDLDLNRFKYSFSCDVSADSDAFTDPAPGNNSYSEHIELLPQAHLIQADLAVTDIFPDSLPNGSVYCRITNHGPDALQNATVDLVTYRTFNPDPQQFGTSSIAKQLSVTLQAGETGVFDTDWDVTTSLYPIEFVCDISLPVLDPDTGNNSYSEIIIP